MSSPERSKASRRIPYARQSINEEDIEAVVAVLRSDWITQGPAIERFERKVAEYCDARHAIAVSSGTAALHLVCQAVGLGPGDRLWTSPNTFVASANCGLYCGASVDFVDIDARTYNMSAGFLRAKLSEAAGNGTAPKVIVPVHFAGQSCEMEPMHACARDHGCLVIEDASHAIGARYRSKAVGECRFSDAAVFSFHPVKIITTGEGGMILTNHDDLHERLIRLRTHGITRDPRRMVDAAHGPWYYQQVDLGFNYRMTDIQAALGASQMDRIGAFVERRRFLAKRYSELLADLPLVLPWQHPDTESSWHLYVVRLKPGSVNMSRLQVFERLTQAGIGVNVHYIPVHTQPFYRKLGFEPGQFPEAERYYSETLSLPMYAGLEESDQEAVVAALRRVLSN